MHAQLNLTADQLLSTTRSVRKRLDTSRRVPRDLIEECLSLAFQAPNGSNRNLWRWVVVDDPTNGYLTNPEPAHRIVRLDVSGQATEVTPQMYSDCEYLGCIVMAVRGTELLSTHWRGLEEPEPRRWDEVRVRGLEEVPLAEFPFRAEVEAALRGS